MKLYSLPLDNNTLRGWSASIVLWTWHFSPPSLPEAMVMMLPLSQKYLYASPYCRIHAHRHYQRLAGLLGIFLHVVHCIDNVEHLYVGSASFVFLILLFVAICFAEDEFGLRCYTGETAARNALHVGFRTGCCTSGYVCAMKCIGLFQLQGVEYHFSLGIGHTGHIDSFDAQVAILVFEDGVGAIETGVNDSNDDAIAVVGLWKLLARAALHLVGVCGLSRLIEFQQGFRTYRNIRHPLQLGNSCQQLCSGSHHQHP